LSVTVKEEIRRVVPVIRLLSEKTDALISVDTYKSEVAEAALEVGAHIVNVIKGTPVSDKLLRLCRKYQAGIILMHMRGTPRTMQRKTAYRDVLADVIGELKKSVEKCRRFGLNEGAIAVDPGIGFAKTAEQSLTLMNSLPYFAQLGCPVFIGTSRKSFIGKVLGLGAGERLMGTAATVACAVLGGAHVVRVHDVALMKQVARMTDAIVEPHGFQLTGRNPVSRDILWNVRDLTPEIAGRSLGAPRQSGAGHRVNEDTELLP
jgi:dihydropteroate synthase